MKIVKPSVELIWVTPNAEKIIEGAARKCYKSEDLITETSYIARIQDIIKKQHFNMFGFADACVQVICDRGVTHEIVRHRVCTFAQESTRYCNYSKGKFDNEITVIEPPGLNIDAFAAWDASCRMAEKDYMMMLACECKPQIARSVLPTCLKTEIWWKTNFQEWRLVFAQRLPKEAHPQMREVAAMIFDVIYPHAPTVFADFVELRNTIS